MKGLDGLNIIGGYTVGTAAAAVAQQAQKGQGNSTTGGSGANDLNAMYGKPHAAIGKVNVRISIFLNFILIIIASTYLNCNSCWSFFMIFSV